MNSKIVVATSNLGKLQEIQCFLDGSGITLMPQSEFNTPLVEENGLSFAENALLKARQAAKSSGLPALGDDSGLCVPALGNAPGIFSARYAGPAATDQENINKLLQAIKPLLPPQRKAFYYCALALVKDPLDPTPIICQAKWVGELISYPQGENGFGYDPLFFLPMLQCTVAQLNPKHKNQISHRAMALKLLIEQLSRDE